MPSVHITFASPLWTVVLCIFIGLGLGFAFYRFTLPVVSRSRRLLLSLLRGLGFSFLLLLLCEPVLRMTRTYHVPARLAVLYDVSASMSIGDGAGTRSAEVEHILRDLLPAALPTGTEARYYGFDAVLHPGTVRLPDSLSTQAEVTDIAQSLEDLLQRKEAEPAQAALLLTDGIVTLGDNPVHAASALGFPVVTIGIGDTSWHRDVILSRVSSNEFVYAGTSVPVEAMLTQNGFDGEQSDVTISEGGKVLGATTLRLQPGGGEQTALLTFVPDTEGLHRYRIRIAPREGEFTASNNERTVSVRVLKSRLRVLVIAASPSPDLVAFRQTVAEQKDFSVTVRTQRFGGGYYEGALTGNIVDSADCIITIGIPTSATPPTAVELLANAVIQKRIPLLFVAGPALDPARLGRLADALPASIRHDSHASGEIGCLPDERQRIHPLITAGGDIEPTVWKSLPPVTWGNYTTSLREGSVQLVAPSMKSVPLPEPVIAARNLAGTRSVGMFAFDLWRWRLMAQGNPGTAGFFSAFLRAAIIWLSSPNDVKPVHAGTLKASYPRGERIVFAADVYNGSAQPVNDADVRITIKLKDRVFPLELRSHGNGQYGGTIEGLEEGEYHWKASAKDQGEVLGTDSGSFSVGGMNLEFLDTRMNADLLRQLAYRSGGTYMPATDARGSLKSALESLHSLRAVAREDSATYEVPHWPWMLGLLVLLFGTEWVIRKRSGML
jgi:hypothetical protein